MKSSWIERVCDDLEPCIYITTLPYRDIRPSDLKTLQTLLLRALRDAHRHAQKCQEVRPNPH